MKKPGFYLISLALLLTLLAGCNLPTGLPGVYTPAALQTPVPGTPLYLPLIERQTSETPTSTVAVQVELPTPTTPPPTPTPEGSYSGPITDPERTGQTLSPDEWWDWPVLPVVSDRARQIYFWGLAHGTDPNRFSKIGDCQVIRQYLLGVFDDPTLYRLGPHEDLIPTIDHFHGSWDRVSMSVRTGFNVASVLTAINADAAQCLPGEIPLECEFRIHNPSIAIISMETWTADRPVDLYEQYLRQIVEFTIGRGVVPILATKADNLEGSHAINAAIVRVAYDYDIPLWNWWRVADALPDHGLTSDGFHLTHASNFFDDESAMEAAWPNRNLSGLQAIDVVYRELNR